VQESFDLVEVELGPALLQLVGKGRRQVSSIGFHGAVEGRGVGSTVSSRDPGKVRNRRVDLACAEGLEQACARGFPVFATGTLRRRHDQHITVIRHRLNQSQRLGQLADRVFVEVFSIFAGIRSADGGSKVFLKIGEDCEKLSRPCGCSVSFNR